MADKTYKLTFEMSDGTEASVKFVAPQGQPGAPGADGVTPHIGDNGNWFIGDTDTGKPSRGEPGADGQPGAGINVTGAHVGQIVKIAAVDADGVPTAWGAFDFSETVKSVVLEGNELDLVHWEHGLGMFEVSSGNGKNIKATLRKTNDDGEIVDVGANFYLKKIHFIVTNDQHDQYSDGGYYHQVDMTSFDDFCHYCDAVYSDGTSETWYGERNLRLVGPNLHTQTKVIENAINEVHDELDKVAKIATDEYINSLIDAKLAALTS